MSCGERAAVRVADVLGDHVADLHLDSDQAKTVAYILGCRTGRFGAHIGLCDHCGSKHFSYHSCRNRHCPSCGSLDQALWAERQLQDLLPVSYFHLVFTLPRSLRPFFSGKTRAVAFDAFFAATSETILESAATLGFRPGILGVLHTWTQKLEQHPHLHFLVSGGGLGENGFVLRRRYLIPRKILRRLFKGKLLARLHKLLKDRQVHVGRHSGHELLRDASLRAWNVDIRKPLAGPEQVVRYFARYTRRIAISDKRIVDYDGQSVGLLYRDRKDRNRQKRTNLDAVTFCRLFLRHILPPRFVRIRRYGLLSNRVRKQMLEICRELLSADSPPLIVDDSRAAASLRIFGKDPGRCPTCRIGRLVVVCDWRAPIAPELVAMVCRPLEPP